MAPGTSSARAGDVGDAEPDGRARPAPATKRAASARREEFETACGRPVDWDPLDGRKACRISESAVGAVEHEAEHEKYIAFFIDAGQRFRIAINAVNGASL